MRALRMTNDLSESLVTLDYLIFTLDNYGYLTAKIYLEESINKIDSELIFHALNGTPDGRLVTDYDEYYEPKREQIIELLNDVGIFEIASPAH